MVHIRTTLQHKTENTHKHGDSGLIESDRARQSHVRDKPQSAKGQFKLAGQGRMDGANGCNGWMVGAGLTMARV